MEYIEIKNLVKVISKKTVLNGINLSIEKGKIYGFIGHNGSGKTMLFRSICNFISPTEGSVYINGEKIEKNTEFPVNAGVIIEYPGFIEEYTGYENLKYLASIRNTIGEDRIEEIFKLVGLEFAKDTKVKKYSLGMKQRLGIAQAVMEYPELLVLDEPINALDDEGVDMVKDLLRDLKSRGCTILIATHTKEILQDLFDKTVRMSDGRILSSE